MTISSATDQSSQTASSTAGERMSLAAMWRIHMRPRGWHDSVSDTDIEMTLDVIERYIDRRLGCDGGNETAAYSCALRLAFALWRAHWAEESPKFTPANNVMGLLLQIDNMTAGLRKPKQPHVSVKSNGATREVMDLVTSAPPGSVWAATGIRRQLPHVPAKKAYNSIQYLCNSGVLSRTSRGEYVKN